MILFLELFLLSNFLWSFTIVDKPHDSMNHLPDIKDPDAIYFSWQLLDWDVWYNRPYAVNLIPDAYKQQTKKETLRTYEARAAFLVPATAAKLSRETLHQVEVIAELDPKNKHILLTDKPGFRVRSTLYFPEHWKMIIEALKQMGHLKPENQAYLEMTSSFGWLDSKTIQNNHQLGEVLGRFKISNKQPVVVNIQEIYDLNEIAQFGNITTFFYEAGPDQLIAFTICVFGIEKDVLQMGHQIGVTAESVLLGQYTQPINTPTGIGGGLPNYTKELLINMANVLKTKLK